MRPVRKHNVSTSDRRVVAAASIGPRARNAAVARNRERGYVPAVRTDVRSGDQVLWSMRYPYRNVSARLAPAKTRRSVLHQLRFELSSGHKVLRTLRQTNSLLSEFQLSFNLCA